MPVHIGEVSISTAPPPAEHASRAALVPESSADAVGPAALPPTPPAFRHAERERRERALRLFAH